MYSWCVRAKRVHAYLCMELRRSARRPPFSVARLAPPSAALQYITTIHPHYRRAPATTNSSSTSTMVTLAVPPHLAVVAQALHTMAWRS